MRQVNKREKEYINVHGRLKRNYLEKREPGWKRRKPEPVVNYGEYKVSYANKALQAILRTDLRIDKKSISAI